MSSKLRLVKISSAHVNQSIDANSKDYNTGFHSEIEAPHLEEPEESPTDLCHWLPLIARTRGIPISSIPVISLSRQQGALIVAAAKSSIHTRQPNRVFDEELQDDVVPMFKSLTYLPGGYFLRLDRCSAKDGVGGIQPIRCVEDIIIRLVTSLRAHNAIEEILNCGGTSSGKPSTAKDTDNDGSVTNLISLYFLPHNPHMRSSREYRVFCPPPFCQVSAISQYKWHMPSFFASRSNEELLVIVGRILDGVQGIRQAILDTNPDMSHSILMRKQGFTFDVMYNEDTGKCGLIELNSFGTRSGCGSCLFQWLTDENILYGRGNMNGDGSMNGNSVVEVEFRISV